MVCLVAPLIQAVESQKNVSDGEIGLKDIAHQVWISLVRSSKFITWKKLLPTKILYTKSKLFKNS